MTDSLATLPGKVSDLVRFVDRGRRETVIDAALVVKDEFKKGPKSSPSWGAGFNVQGASNPTALVRYRGPVHWEEGGVSPHVITPRGFVGTRRTRGIRALDGASRVSSAKVGRGAARAVKYDGKVRRVAYHPGRKARPFFGQVKKKSARAASETVRVGLRRNIARAGFGAAANLR